MRFKLLRWFNGLMVDRHFIGCLKPPSPFHNNGLMVYRHFIGLIMNDTGAGFLTGVVLDLIGLKSNQVS
jgi:hypothetical protein